MKGVEKDVSHLRCLLLCERLAKKKLIKKQSCIKFYNGRFGSETLGNAKQKIKTMPMVGAKPRGTFCEDLTAKTVLKSFEESGDLAPTKTTRSLATTATRVATPQHMIKTPPLSPKKAARATMLKKRFAGTISKAHRQLFAPPTIVEQRQAAREALEELERSVDIEDSHKSFKDLERLCGFPIPYPGGFVKRMHVYGLYLKN